MKRAGAIVVAVILISLLQACGENPRNTFGGPTNAADTATSHRDTSSIGTRTDR